MIQRASLEARKTATGLMSSGAPMRPSGVVATRRGMAVPLQGADVVGSFGFGCAGGDGADSDMAGAELLGQDLGR